MFGLDFNPFSFSRVAIVRNAETGDGTEISTGLKNASITLNISENVNFWVGITKQWSEFRSWLRPLLDICPKYLKKVGI